MTVAIVQARMGSTRLPGKVLADLAGRPVLARVIERTRRAQRVDAVVVATTDDPADDPIAALCYQLDVACFRGSEHDVLDRYYQAARYHHADAIVRITADCPLIDPQVIDRVITAFVAGKYDYMANINPPTYPDGLDTEICSFAALERSWLAAKLRSEREHVTLYIRNHPELFRSGNVVHDHDLSNLRWVVDEPRDLGFVRAIYAALDTISFDMAQVLKLLDQQPELIGLNNGILRNEGLIKSLQQDGAVR
jgi:spore coat polysaccharide biosynthesis protein SpsF (cytidylyltransferase family)